MRELGGLGGAEYEEGKRVMAEMEQQRDECGMMTGEQKQCLKMFASPQYMFFQLIAVLATIVCNQCSA